MVSEEWRDVPGYEGVLQVSSLGRVRTVDREVKYVDGRIAKIRGRILSDFRGGPGYRQVNAGRRYGGRTSVHILVAKAFKGPKPDWAECVNHIDGNKENNVPDNIEWSTYAANNRHARESGLLNQHGENCNLTKYSDHIVKAIRNVYAEYKPTYKKLADLFEVSPTMAAQVVKMQTRRR